MNYMHGQNGSAVSSDGLHKAMGAWCSQGHSQGISHLAAYDLLARVEDVPVHLICQPGECEDRAAALAATG